MQQYETRTKQQPLLTRAATMLLLALLTMTAQTAWAQTTETVSYMLADGTTHTSPSFCELSSHFALEDWAMHDDSLMDDVRHERQVMDDLYNDLYAKKWADEDDNVNECRLANVEDGRDVRNLIFNRLHIDVDISDAELLREVIERYGERYTDMALSDWRHIIKTYTPMVREASRPKAKEVSMEPKKYNQIKY